LSLLTKVFVVSLAVLSMMFVAGVVVFVNKVEDFQAYAKAQADLATRAQTERNNAAADAQTARAEAEKAIAAANVRATAAEQAANTAQADLQKAQGDVQQANLKVEQANVQVTTALGGQKSAQEALKAAEVALNETRKQADDLQKKYNEAVVALSDQTNKLDVMRKQYQKSQEDIVALQQENTTLRNQGAAPRPGGGQAPAAGAPGAAQPGSAQVASANGENLKGVVRTTKDIQGVKYATISIGSADNVQRNMQFKVIDRSANRFLGYLTIDNVDYNEATGHLSGPAIKDVRTGTEVITQWQ
jgi:hypothetical protein